MEHYSIEKLCEIGTMGMLQERKHWLKRVIANRTMCGQNCDATRADLAKIEAVIKRLLSSKVTVQYKAKG